MTDIAAALAEPFPKELLRVNKHKGNITYVAGSEVIARLNRVLGVDGWSYEVIRLWEAGEKETETGVYPVWCMAHVRLSLPWQGVVSTRDGVGGQQVKFLNNGTGPNDIGDEYKGAVTDALKKAAQSLGVALDLARGEEAMRWEADQSDDIDCPHCGSSIKGAKSDREPMRAHLVEMHEFVRLPDGAVQKPKPPEVPPEGGGGGEDVRTGLSSPPIPDKPALGGLR